MIGYAKRFWSKVDRSGECWLWTASITSHGYGQFVPSGRGSNTAAHRLAWLLTHGEIPPGMCVLHRCDVRRCVRPSHLFLGTKADNTADMMKKGRNRFVVVRGKDHVQTWDGTKVLRGQRHGMSKLSDEVVADLRKRYRRGGVSMYELAAELGVAMPTVRKAVRGLGWAHVSEPPVYA